MDDPFATALAAVPPALVDELAATVASLDGPAAPRPPAAFLAQALTLARGDVGAAARALHAADFGATVAAARAARAADADGGGGAGAGVAPARLASMFTDRLVAALGNEGVEAGAEPVAAGRRRPAAPAPGPARRAAADPFTAWRGLSGEAPDSADSEEDDDFIGPRILPPPPPPPPGAPPDPVVPDPGLFDFPALGPDTIARTVSRGPYRHAPATLFLPAPGWRGAGGHLWSDAPGAVPPSLPGAPLTFPLLAGTVVLPVRFPPSAGARAAAALRLPVDALEAGVSGRRAAAAATAAAAAKKKPTGTPSAAGNCGGTGSSREGSPAPGGPPAGSSNTVFAPISMGGGPLKVDGLKNVVWRARGTLPSASGGHGRRVEASIPMGPNTPAASVAAALARLDERGAVSLKARFVPLGPGDAAGVGLAVEVALTARAFTDPAAVAARLGEAAAKEIAKRAAAAAKYAAVAVPGRVSASSSRPPSAGRASKGPDAEALAAETAGALGHDSPDLALPTFPPKPASRLDAKALACVLHALATLGDGLRVGADCNGALNLFDPTASPPLAGDLSGAARDVPALLARCGLPPGAPLAPAPAGLATAPLPHQLSGLRWMLDREGRGDARGHGGAALHPLWVQLVGADGQVFHAFRGGSDGARLSARLHTAPFLRAGHTAGGILCDAMGVGKTLEVLALTLARPAPPGWAVQPATAGEGGEAWAARSAPVCAALAAAAAALTPDAGRDALPEPVPVKTTLVVAPANLVGQWADQAASHVRGGALTVGIYAGAAVSARLGAAARGRGEDVEAAEEGGGRGADPPSATTAAAARPPARAAAKRARAGAAGANASSSVLAAAAAAEGAGKAPEQAADTGEDALAWCTPAGGGSGAAAGSQGARRRPIPLAACDLVLISYEDLRAELGWRGKSPLARVGLWRLVLDEAQLVANSSSVAAAMASALWRRHAWVVTGTPVSYDVGELRGLLEFLGVDPFQNDKAWRTLALTAVGHPAAPLAALLRVVALRRTQADAHIELPPCTRRDVRVALSTVERAAYEAARARLAATAAAFRAGRRGPSAVHRLRALYVALRQTACHPQAGARAAALLGVGEGTRGPRLDPAAAIRASERLPMAVIMDRLVRRAGAAADTALRALTAARFVEAGAARSGGCGQGGGGGAGHLLGDAAALRALLQSVGAEAEALVGAVAGGEADAALLERAVVGRRAGGGELAPGGGAWGGAGPGPAGGARRLAAALQALDPPSSHIPGAQATPAPRQPKGRNRKRGRGGGGGRSRQATPVPGGEGGAGGDGPPAPPAAASPLAERAFAWAGLFLDGLDLLTEVEREAGAAAAAEGLEAAAALLRAVLGGDGGGGGGGLPVEVAADAAATVAVADAVDAAQMRFSRRARGMDVDEELGAAAARSLEADRAAARAAANVFLRTARAARARAAARSGAGVGYEVEAVGAGGGRLAASRTAWAALAHTLRTADEAADEVAALGGGGGGSDDDGSAAAAGADPADHPPASAQACPICFDGMEPGFTAVAPCAHVFCTGCLGEALASRRACPLCRAPLDPADVAVAAAPPTAAEVEAAAARATAAAAGAAEAGAFLSDEALRSEWGAKLAAAVAAAHEARAGGGKAVIFSAWARLLALTGSALEAAGLKSVSLAGAAPAARAAALEAFRADDSVSALLIVLSTGGGAAGLSLPVASHCVLLEPQLNSGLEAQAASRIHRLGQTRPTFVYRVVASRTIDEPIVEEAAARAAEAGGDDVEHEEEDGAPMVVGVGLGEDENMVLRLLERHP